MYYEINVALNGRHYFATAQRSLRGEAEALEMLADMRKRYPTAEGFEVTCSRNEIVCRTVEVA